MNDSRKDKGIKILLIILIILAAAVLVSDFSLWRKRTVNIAGAGNGWAKLELILQQVEANYVDSLDKKKITEDILPGIMAKLDPHSVYLPPEELQTAEEDLSGEFSGIGIQFTVPNDTALVSNVIVGGPSEKAGILSGDKIISVNDTVIAGVQMPQDSMVKLMRGPKGTKVRIKIQRQEGEPLVAFDIRRDRIPANSIDVAFMVNDTTGYIKLSKFSRNTYQEFIDALEKLKGMKKLVLDLRENGGGYLDQALLVANEFLEKGKLMVYMEGAHYNREEIFADGRGKCKNTSIYVLMDEGSASSSEIVAGALQDNDRGTIVGLRSFGKGLVQEPIYFSDGSGIRLTVARYHTPTGRCIQKPYSDDYMYDIYERYRSGEMMSADSIKVNDSLKFTTPGGKVVYGGGGIIPDIFVPIDTTGYTEFLGKCNRNSLAVKYANNIFEANRGAIRNLTTMSSLRSFLNSLDIKGGFLAYAAGKDIVPQAGDWEISGEIITKQIEAFIGRYTPMGDEAFYRLWLEIDRTALKAIEQ